jgi:leucyl aminopeptidase
MNFELKTLSLPQAAHAAADALVVLLPDSGLPTSDAGPFQQWLAEAIAHKDLDDGAGKCLLAYQLPISRARRVVVARVGAGKPAEVRKATAAAVGLLKGHQPNSLTLYTGAMGTPGSAENAAATRAAMLAVADSTYVFTTTKPGAKARSLVKVLVAGAGGTGLKAAFDEAAGMVRGIELAKEWANRPANHATPTLLAKAAQQLGKRPRMSVDVLGPREVAKLGMGAFMAVAQGSEEPLRFIVMKYQGGAKSAAPVVLVGKGITFDTGGISLKPAPEMDEMKFDMGGAASVLGTFAALADLQPAINVVGLIPAAENMPDGRAVKPGDVVTSMSGQTIEILNTDAEGRLVLCDTLTYAERFKPRAVIDIATLTGACVIALGAVRAGLFSDEEALAQQLLAAGETALDPCWRMPLDEEYAEGLKSNFADMGNVAGRQAGAVTAAKFLQKFAKELPWAHLDIAGVAWKSGAAKGATGRPVGLLTQYLLDEAKRTANPTPTPTPGPAKAVKATVKAAVKKAPLTANTKPAKPTKPTKPQKA